MKNLLLAAVCCLLSAMSWAHKPSDSYLTLVADKDKTSAQLDLALRDLDVAIGLDDDGNGEITWGELRRAETRISSYALSRLDIFRADRPCKATHQQLMVNQHVDGAYASLMLSLDCSDAGTSSDFRLSYRLFFDIDRLHKSIVTLKVASDVSTAVISADANTVKLSPGIQSGGKQWLNFVSEGVWHIWIGYDHILFLIALLLPAVMTLHGRQWRPAASFRDVLRDAVYIVTAFTVAHSITLTLAAFEWVNLPSRWVESVIALSVVLAALNNIVPLVHGRRWVLTFVFGLIHGFGFASVLGGLGLGARATLLTVSGFNIGVELGQLAIVGVFLPLAFLLRKKFIYVPLVLRGGSVIIALLAAVWLAERAFNLQLLPTGVV